MRLETGLCPDPDGRDFSAPANPKAGFKGLLRGKEQQGRKGRKGQSREERRGIISLPTIPGSATGKA